MIMRLFSPSGIRVATLLLALGALSGGIAQAQSPQRIYGCSAAQIQSAKADACMKKLDKDVIAGYKNIHVLRCESGRVECCIKLEGSGWGSCENALVAPRDTKGIADRSPKPAAVECATLKSVSGVWTADASSIKAAADKKSCSQTFRCTAPSPASLSADEKTCKPVITVSNKAVTQSGTCVPGSKPGTCSSCLAKQPNDPCTIAFRK
jgi:hypothetical protein